MAKNVLIIIDDKHHEIWADNVDDLKRIVLAKNLLLDDSKVLEAKSFKGVYVGAIEHGCSLTSLTSLV